MLGFSIHIYLHTRIHCGVVCCGVVCCGVVWCGVLWCDTGVGVCHRVFFGVSIWLVCYGLGRVLIRRVCECVLLQTTF